MPFTYRESGSYLIHSGVLVPSRISCPYFPFDAQFLPRNSASLCHAEPFFPADFDRAGTQWYWKNQRAECPHAGPPGLQCPPTHPPLHGAYSEGKSHRQTLALALVCLMPAHLGRWECFTAHWYTEQSRRFLWLQGQRPHQAPSVKEYQESH